MAHPAVVATNLSKTFHRPFPRLRKMIGRDVGGVHAVRGVNLEIQQGEIFGLVGRNGQGKTTLIKMMATLIQPTSGSVQIFGVDAERNQEQVKQMIGLVSADERSFQGRLTGGRI